jgi:hypothetical protein
MSEQTEHDVTPRANMLIWGYFAVFALVLYVTLEMLNVFFRQEAEREYDVKIGSVKSRTLIELRQHEDEALKNIGDAMDKVVREAR